MLTPKTSAWAPTNENYSEVSMRTGLKLINLLEYNWLEHKWVAVRNPINGLNWRVIPNTSTDSEMQLESNINIKASP
jgi:hypothetical protein